MQGRNLGCDAAITAFEGRPAKNQDVEKSLPHKNFNIASAISLLLTLLLSACSDSAQVAPASAPAEIAFQEISYDPSTCKTDAQGMVYFALGREVFRRPAQPGMRMRPGYNMPAEELATLPPRPDPNEPIGCPGNPVWEGNYEVDYQHVPKDIATYPAGTSFRVNSLSFIAISQRTWNSGVDVVKWGTQAVYEKDFERTRDEYNACEVLENGLSACRVPQPGRDILNWPTRFQAVLPVHDAPFDRPFTVSCRAWASIDRQDCSVSYNYSESTRIAYSFELHELPAMEVIEFDKGLRATIESMRVPDYRWPDEMNN